MRLIYFASAIALFMISGGTLRAQETASPASVLTLRSLGAAGDGKTDDRTAIEKALNSAQGVPVDGEGLTYAVHGNIEVTTNVDFRNAKLVQIMEPSDLKKYFEAGKNGAAIKVEPTEANRSIVKGLPVMRPDGVGVYDGDPLPSEADLATFLPSITLRTLSIRGDEGKPISVNLEKISVDRGKHPGSGGRNDGAGVLVNYASPVNLRDLEITGDGKGKGLGISNSSKVRIERMHIHDMNWAPYAGDEVLEQLSADEVRDEFGWNNFPIYEYREGMKRFVRVRIQEQLVGMFILSSRDVEILDSKVERLQVKIGDQLYPLQCDGMTINRVENILIRNCEISRVWEGIDFTGAAGRDFVFENCTVSDTLGWAFKLAHPKQNGKILHCKAVRPGLSGFVIGADSENITLSHCEALETGANGYWVKADGSKIMALTGFRIEAMNVNGDEAQTPHGIHLEHCSAINKLHPGTMDYGILCEPKSDNRDISLVDFTTQGAKIGEMKGITQQSAAGSDASTADAPQAAAKSADQVAWEAMVTPKYLTWPAMQYVEGNPNLPNVLLIGDSISIAYTAYVRKALEGKANVYRIPNNGGSTRDGLEKMQQWLHWRDKWDVIHFNFGLHDLKRRSKESKAPDQLDVNGTIEVPVEQYTQNLEKLVFELKQTGAKLIWASTTPIPAGAAGRITGDEQTYNAAAEQVMKNYGVRIDDLYGFILPHLAEAQQPPDVHFMQRGNELLGEQVAREITVALP